jgi:hypothetical protein
MSPPARSTNHAPLYLLLIAFVLLGSLYAVITPLFEISDELWHYPMVKTLADGNPLPVQNPANVGPWRQEGSQPPLYYGLMALATSWIDTSDMDQVRWLNPHADNGLITEDGNNNIVIHTYREAWPWRGTVLAVRLIRLISVALGAGTVYFTYRLALELAPERRALAVAAAAFSAFTPMFLFVSGSVNNDNLAIFCSAGALWLLARVVRQPPARLGWTHAWLGILLGCGALSKQSALGLFPLAGAAWLYAHFYGGKEKRRTAFQSWMWDVGLGLVVVFGLALLICFWWYLRNYQLYGDWLGWNQFIAIVGRRPNPATLAQLWGERVGFVQAYWGLFGGVSVPMPGWTYLILNLMMGVALMGAAAGLVRAILRGHVSLTDVALWALLLAWVALILIGLIRWTSLTWASQGRLIFPAISAISVLAVSGLAQLGRLPPIASLPSPISQAFPWLAVAFMCLLSATVPFAVIGPHYAPPPGLTSGQIAALPNRLEADFGGEMKLLGYDLQTGSVAPGERLRLTLYWQSQIAMDRDWSIFVHLVDDQDIVVAQRDRYPGRGALATTLLRPGQSFADAYVIPVPGGTYAPAPARIEVGLYDVRDGARLRLPDGADALPLAQVDIRARPDSTPNAVRQNFGNLVQLAGYKMGARVLKPGETLHLTLFWQALAPIDVNYSVFTHVRGEAEALWASDDAWPQDGAAPTSTWTVGQIITDTYALTLSPDTPAGTYDVEVGLYELASLERLRVMDAEGLPTDADFLYLSRVRVVAP